MAIKYSLDLAVVIPAQMLALLKYTLLKEFIITDTDRVFHTGELHQRHSTPKTFWCGSLKHFCLDKLPDVHLVSDPSYQWSLLLGTYLICAVLEEESWLLDASSVNHINSINTEPHSSFLDSSTQCIKMTNLWI